MRIHKEEQVDDRPFIVGGMTDAEYVFTDYMSAVAKCFDLAQSALYDLFQCEHPELLDAREYCPYVCIKRGNTRIFTGHLLPIYGWVWAKRRQGRMEVL